MGKVFYDGELLPEEMLVHSCWEVVDGYRIMTSEPVRYCGTELYDKNDKNKCEPCICNFRPL